jgi:hypothetical protein
MLGTPPLGARRRVAAAVAAALVALVLASCGDTLQDKPVPHNELEKMVVSPFAVYWVGAAFAGMQLTDAGPDPSGAFTVQYGNCVQGGQGTCTPPLRIVTNPDNSFLPGGDTPTSVATLRGVPAKLTEAGRALAIPTGPVVVDVYARDATLAKAAARAMVAINRPSNPGEPLPTPQPDTGFGAEPLPSQKPVGGKLPS